MFMIITGKTVIAIILYYGFVKYKSTRQSVIRRSVYAATQSRRPLLKQQPQKWRNRYETISKYLLSVDWLCVLYVWTE